jgi:hypothetical protein
MRIPLSFRYATHAALAALVCLTTACFHQDGWTVREAGEAWRFAGFREAHDLSGIARASGRHAIVVADESHELQPGILDLAKRTLQAADPIKLPVQVGKQGKKKPEADLEAVAWNPLDSCYYVIGSHGVGKKKGDHQASRHLIFRIPFNAATGHLNVSGIERATLTPIIEGIAELRPFVHQPLQQNGLNIEGMAARAGRLWIGLRAPSVAGNAFILEVDPKKLFGSGADAVVHMIHLGRGRGIRELAAVSDGLLILAGNAAAEASKRFPESEATGPDRSFTLHHWIPRRNSAPLIARLPVSDGKAEGLMVIGEQTSSIKVLVLFDGILAGGPRAFVLARPRDSGV